MTKRLYVLMVTLSWAVPATAQVKAGPEFPVNSFTTDVQRSPDISMDRSGRFVVVWNSRQDGSVSSVDARRFESDGAPRGAEFVVNTYTTGLQTLRFSSALDRGQRLTVIWDGEGAAPGATLFGRRFDRAGAPLGPDFAVTGYTTATEAAGGVAGVPGGDFVVTWERTYPYPSFDSAIFVRRFASDGRPLGAPLQVNAATSAARFEPDVAIDGGGAFVVVWASLDQIGSPGDRRGIFGRRFDASGAPRGDEFRVSTPSAYTVESPAVAVRDDGRFVVAWQRGGVQAEVRARVFDATGNPTGNAFLVHGATTTPQEYPRVAMEESGAFVVVWRSRLGSSIEDVMARRFDPSGSARGLEFRVNAVPGRATDPDVASDAVGNFVVAWSQIGLQAISPTGQRFGGLQPVALALDTVAGAHSNGNGVLEPNENVDVRTTWRNVNGAAQTFAGVLTVSTPDSMPTPPTPSPLPFPYSVADGDGDYGAVPEGGSRDCVDCYTVNTLLEPPQPAPSPSPWIRPPGHVDGAVWETITPDTQGQHKKWLLHLGDTFNDVVRSSPFYRFVETLVHNGVTAGCSTTAYCPGQSVTREQMAVFVLAADDRYATPPACGTPHFDDVPASSPFCRWIEELARRGVTGGCTAASFCPGDAVTREQMAVFALRTFDPNLDPPACTTPVFGDVPASSPFCRWVEELARRGVVTGCAPGLYCPMQPVSREQMAVFLSATFGLRLYGP